MYGRIIYETKCFLKFHKKHLEFHKLFFCTDTNLYTVFFLSPNEHKAGLSIQVYSFCCIRFPCWWQLIRWIIIWSKTLQITGLSSFLLKFFCECPLHVYLPISIHPMESGHENMILYHHECHVHLRLSETRLVFVNSIECRLSARSLSC